MSDIENVRLAADLEFDDAEREITGAVGRPQTAAHHGIYESAAVPTDPAEHVPGIMRQPRRGAGRRLIRCSR